MTEARDALEYANTNLSGRVLNAGMSFFIAGVCLLFTLPIWQGKGDPYPWGFGAVAWTLAALAILGGVGTVTRRSGVSFDRGKGMLILWSTSFGRRRERRIPLGGFTEIGVRTWVQTQSRSGVDCRYYDVELRGPKQRERMGTYPPVNTGTNIPRIAAFLKLPLVVQDEMPGREPRHDL